MRCVTYCDGCVVAWAGEGAVWEDDLLMYRKRAPLWFGLSAALRQVVVVDLVLFVGNLLTEPEGTTEQRQAKTLLSSTALTL